MLAAFLRNDKNPTLATVAVLAGGIFNVFGDYVFIFTFDMGIFGAGLATALGSTLSFGIMMTHFISKKNTLKLVKPTRVLNKLYRIMITGFSTFFIDIAMGILTIVFNRQIMKYFGANALSIYGIIINISTFVQCCAYSVGQAAQPIISANFGAKQGLRIKETLKYALFTVLFFSIFWTALIMVKPMLFVDLFMTPTPEITSIAPSIMRAYGISFILLPLNIFSTYYFQAIIQPKTAFIISVGRGLVVSCLFIYLLPVILGKQSLWYAMFMTELIVAIYTVYKMSNSTKEFK